MGPNHIPLLVLDGVLSLFRGPKRSLDTYFTDHTGIAKYRGTIDKPYESLQWAILAEEGMWLQTGGAYPHGADPSEDHLYIEGMFQPDSNNPQEILGFVHLEDWAGQGRPGHKNFNRYKIGIAYSQNGGKAWTYCGHILQTKNTVPATFGGYHNIGGTPYIIHNGFFYLYFTEYIGERDVRRIGVVRAPTAEVLKAARKGEVVLWNKYRDGAWDQPGMTGEAGSVVFPYRNTDALHTDAVYSTATKKYYLLVVIINSRRDVELQMFSSTDGIKWGNSVVIDRQRSSPRNAFSWIGFPAIISVSEASARDGHRVGEEFFVIYPKRAHRAKIYGQNELYRVRIRLRPAP